MYLYSSTDLIGLLSDGTGFNMLGDHGGGREKEQRIPIILYAPGLSPGKDSRPLRLVDIAPLVSRIMGIDRE
jgi:hypothetical protein